MHMVKLLIQARPDWRHRVSAFVMGGTIAVTLLALMVLPLPVDRTISMWWKQSGRY
jgi:multisubunit Na+/H+ antiporter MnhB subunit